MLSPGEWDSAAHVELFFQDPQGDPVTVHVWLMHDGASLQLAYELTHGGNGAVFFAPELLLDASNDGGSSLGADDWWFHVSGSDCAARGRYDDYSVCTLNPVGWDTGPDARQREGRSIDAFEIRISFSTVGISVGRQVGLGVQVLHSVAIAGVWTHTRAFWPTGGSPVNPATWQTAQLLPRS